MTAYFLAQSQRLLTLRTRPQCTCTMADGNSGKIRHSHVAMLTQSRKRHDFSSPTTGGVRLLGTLMTSHEGDSRRSRGWAVAHKVQPLQHSHDESRGWAVAAARFNLCSTHAHRAVLINCCCHTCVRNTGSSIPYFLSADFVPLILSS
ncbi:hypothetical protein KP509_26G053400 [Ceratopteris richardii]|uniref:Uncharacterized protein n=1 Tax=Ceratopteris richardii TaxID=49495 RepID=A0A8T2RNL9_CERRI|nr:hypothetical protein KP509_26G053400 [Ceratopteris richardii]